MGTCVRLLGGIGARSLVVLGLVVGACALGDMCMGGKASPSTSGPCVSAATDSKSSAFPNAHRSSGARPPSALPTPNPPESESRPCALERRSKACRARGRAARGVVALVLRTRVAVVLGGAREIEAIQTVQ